MQQLAIFSPHFCCVHLTRLQIWPETQYSFSSGASGGGPTLLTDTQRMSCCHVDLAWGPSADFHLIPSSRHYGG